MADGEGARSGVNDAIVDIDHVVCDGDAVELMLPIGGGDADSTTGMGRLIPEFKTYAEEVAFWDNLDTADLMDDDGEWFHFETSENRAIRVAILPDVVNVLAQRAHT